MKYVLVYSGIAINRLFIYGVYIKMNFQNLGNVRNFNGSIPEDLSNLGTAAENGFGSFGVFMFGENALLGSLKRDWGSVRFGEQLNLSSKDCEKNFEEIKTEIDSVNFFGGLQSDIKKIANQYREEIPESVQKIWEDFEPLLEKLNKPQFNKEDFKKEYEKFCEKYKSKNTLFEDNVIKPIITKINEILKNSTSTSDDTQTIKEQLDKHFDVALRIVNKTDIYHYKYKITKYNEVHLPPLLQLIEGFFIIDDGKYDNIEEKLKLYKTIKDVREILFLPQENHTEENFKKLTPEKQESLNDFFDRKEQGYKRRIDNFFHNQEKYIVGIIKNLENKEKLLLEVEGINEEITQIKKLKSNLSDSINREKLPNLLKKPFSLYLFDPQSKSIMMEDDFIRKIQDPSLNDLQKQKLTLFYVGIGVLDFEKFKEMVDYNSLTFDSLNLVLKEEKNDNIKKIVIKASLETGVLKDLTVKNIKKLCNLVVSYTDSYDYNYNKSLINKALETGALKDLTVKNVTKLCNLVVSYTDSYDYNYNKSLINKALETGAIKDLKARDLKYLCGLVQDNDDKKLIIDKALEKEAITGYSKENLTKMIIPSSSTSFVNLMPYVAYSSAER